MSEAYDGREIVGMDLHRRRSVLVRMTPDGRKLETTRITNSPAELRRVIARAGKHPRVVLEATYGWYWAADTLAAAGAKVHLAHPLGVRGFRYRRVKNDEKDAADLADLLRLGRLPEAWIAPAEIRELRELTRYRIKLVRLRTSCKDQVHAVLAKLGIPVTCTDIFGVWGNTWLDGLELGQPYAGKVASLRTLAGELTAEITVLEAAIADLLARHDGYHAIRALPGIGPVLGAVLVAEIGDITRFATPAPRVRHHGQPRAHHQAGVAARAVGAGGSDPARARRPPAAPAQGGHPRPPRRPGEEHRQDRRRAPAAHLGLLRDARRPGPRPGHRHAEGGVSRPGRRQRVIAGFTGPAVTAAAAWSD